MKRIKNISAADQLDTTPMVYAPFYREEGFITWDSRFTWVINPTERLLGYYVHITQNPTCVKCDLTINGPSNLYNNATQHFGMHLHEDLLSNALYKLIIWKFDPKRHSFQITTELSMQHNDDHIGWFQDVASKILNHLNAIMNEELNML